MFSGLFRHPFGVEAFFKSSLVLAYGAPRELLAKMLPPYLEVDTFEEQLGFVAVAFVDTRRLRPQGFPAWLGRDFILAGYRIFVRYRDARGRRLRGLYILRSETNRWQMKLLGDVFTSYRYHQLPLEFIATPQRITVSSKTSSPGGLFVEATIPAEGQIADLPPQSPFSSWHEARRYSGPLPFTFSYDALRSEMVIVKGIRQGWEPQPVTITHATIPTLTDLGLDDLRLANAFLVRDIPYRWQAGIVERLPHSVQTQRGEEKGAEDPQERVHEAEGATDPYD